MKRLLPFFLFLFVLPSFGQTAGTLLVKQHDSRPDFAERPYGKDDLSYGLFLDAFEGIGGWRFGASYSDDLTGIPAVETVITPEITLLFVENIWVTGLSVLIDYIELEGDEGWGDVYFQAQLGINVPLGNRMSIGALAFYPMESFDDLFDIGFSDLDLGVQFRVFF